MATKFSTPKGMPLKERLAFRSEPQPNGCIHFIGFRDKNGYGRIRIGGRKGESRLAHRISYEIAYGEIPDGLCLCHKCDNPSCINPEHLFVGTHADNMEDAAKKGRMRRGEEKSISKLKEVDIPIIRADPRPQHVIAKDYGVSQTVIGDVKLRVTWKHVP